jgi:starch synthase (maltosyl-transferring)
MQKIDGRTRVIIEGVKPELDGGRFPIKRVTGESVTVEADVFTDGHDAITVMLWHRKKGEPKWVESPMRFLVNDRWRGEFVVNDLGRYEYTICAWVDRFRTWRHDTRKKVDAGQDVSVELLMGADLLEKASKRAKGVDARTLKTWANLLRSKSDMADRVRVGLSDEVYELKEQYPAGHFMAVYEKELEVVVDRERARFSSWYEMFPRSCAAEPGRHGTFKDLESRLAYVAEMGFDVLYLPPIHPVGTAFRKGKNNALTCGPDDVGSPWAIGSKAGGHKAIHPQLGTLADFRRLVAKSRTLGMEIALDIAFQCSPDHPYVKDHPEWFRRRPDGTIQYAENPPKKYQDIYPFDFETENWRELWTELKSVFEFWIKQGVHIFRVDNPHTKAFGFWEWCIGELKQKHPELIFLAEAFTRPKIMHRLARLGYTQSYTYFAWRNTKWELTEYLTELTRGDGHEYFRPNFWPNTPDILTEALQHGGRPMFMSRLVLAATMTANYGIYGPAFELCENRPREFRSEEYLDSEKYEIKRWDIDRSDSLRHLIARVNHIRRAHACLQTNHNLRFHQIGNDQLIAYSKSSADKAETILVVVNLDPHHTQSGWLTLPLEELQIDPHAPFQVHDLLSDARYLWNGPRNYVEINPHILPAHVFRIRRRMRSEKDFDYYT